jgi:NADP-dependent 3-hydroxy acid dehydrogenase YdfG
VSDERVMLITGASTGIGAATARMAAADGYRLVLAARSEDKLRSLIDEIGEEHALAHPCDVMRWEQQEKLVAAALDRFGRIDVAFANAGFGAKRGFLEETPEHWHDMVNTNVLGVAYTIRAVLPHMRERGSGHFVLTSSVAGRRALPGSLYSATKWAVCGMGEALRQELAETDIRTTLVEPGMVDTPFFESEVSDALEADDIARVVMFALAQPARVDVNEVLVRPVHQPS